MPKSFHDRSDAVRQKTGWSQPFPPAIRVHTPHHAVGLYGAENHFCGAISVRTLQHWTIFVR